MAQEGNSCLDCLESCLSGEAVQVAYGNKDYAVGLCVFGRELASFGQRHRMTHHLCSEKQNNGGTTKREMLDKLQNARHIIISKHAVQTRMFV